MLRIIIANLFGFDAQGNLYGTTYAGGAKRRGTVFRLSPNGSETVLYNFNPKTQDGSILAVTWSWTTRGTFTAPPFWAALTKAARSSR
jgi:uncharacterized repeat protein (TIGR03803 family)